MSAFDVKVRGGGVCAGASAMVMSATDCEEMVRPMGGAVADDCATTEGERRVEVVFAESFREKG